jgi:hypothetical protein
VDIGQAACRDLPIIYKITETLIINLIWGCPVSGQLGQVFNSSNVRDAGESAIFQENFGEMGVESLIGE